MVMLPGRLPRVLPWVRHATCTWLVLATLAVGASLAQAQGLVILPEEPPDLALELYQRGQAAYSAGKVREASHWFEQALLLDPQSAALTYQVALVYEQLGDLTKAVHYYERYLHRLAPQDAEERVRIHRTLRRLRAALRLDEEDEAGKRRTPLLVDREAPSDAVRLEVEDTALRAPETNLWAWTIAGGGVGLLMAGALTGVWAARKQGLSSDPGGLSTTEAGSTHQPTARAPGARLQIAADVMLGVGAVSLGLALLLLWTSPTRQDTETVAWLDHDSAGVRVDF